MRKQRLLGLLFLLLLSVGCGGDKTPTALLQSISDLKATIGEIIAELEAGDIAAVDAVMHRQEFKPMLDSLELLSKQPILGAAGRQSVTDASERIMTQLRAIHAAAPAHNGAGIEAIDVPTAKKELNEALALLEEALPPDWTLPAAKHAHDDHAHEDHAEHDHAEDDHDHGDDAHDHGDEDHAGEHDEAHSPK